METDSGWRLATDEATGELILRCAVHGDEVRVDRDGSGFGPHVVAFTSRHRECEPAGAAQRVR